MFYKLPSLCFISYLACILGYFETSNQIIGFSDLYRPIRWLENTLTGQASEFNVAYKIN